MIIKSLDNGWDADQAYKLTKLQAYHDRRKYREEWNNLSVEEQIQWAVIHAKLNMIEIFED